MNTGAWWFLAGFVSVCLLVAVVSGLLTKSVLWAEERRLAREPRTVTVTIVADTTRFVAAMKAAGLATRRMGSSCERVGRSMTRFREEVQWKAYLHRQLVLVRLAGKFRLAVLDPAYADPDALYIMVRFILTGVMPGPQPVPWSTLFHLTDAERLELAVSVIDGWGHAYAPSRRPEPSVSIRQYGNATVTVLIA